MLVGRGLSGWTDELDWELNGFTALAVNGVQFDAALGQEASRLVSIFRPWATAGFGMFWLPAQVVSAVSRYIYDLAH